MEQLTYETAFQRIEAGKHGQLSLPRPCETELMHGGASVWNS